MMNSENMFSYLQNGKDIVLIVYLKFSSKSHAVCV